LPLDVFTTKRRIELDDGVGDGVEDGIELGINGSYKRSLNVGGVNGGHDVSSITLCHLFMIF